MPWWQETTAPRWTPEATQSLQTALYGLPAADFHDIITGFNGYNAGTGYDLVTGIGTPVANLLVPDLAGTSIDYTVPTTGSPHQLVLERAVTTASGHVDLFDNGIVIGSAPAATFSEANITDPNTSNDSLTVDYARLDGFFTGGVNFDHTGDPGYDTVIVNAPNGPSNTTVVSESPYTAGDSTVTVDGAAQTMNLKNVSEVDINDGPGGDAVTVSGGGNDKSGLQAVKVLGGAGNDSLDVDSSNGLAAFPNGIFFDGGAGFNSLYLTQTVNANLPNNATQTSDVYSVGPNSGRGHRRHHRPPAARRPSTSRTWRPYRQRPGHHRDRQRHPAANAINYAEGPGGGIFGSNHGHRDRRQPGVLEFTSKTNLVINGLAGSDVINLNNPTTPTGLTGSHYRQRRRPTTGDTLIANGTPAQDTINFAPTRPTPARSPAPAGPHHLRNDRKRPN